MLHYAMLLNEPDIQKSCLKQFETADNMTDVIGALHAMNNIDCPERSAALESFYHKWQHPCNRTICLNCVNIAGKRYSYVTPPIHFYKERNQ